MNSVPFIPESAPFSVEQRAWLNGFLAGLYSQPPSSNGASPALAAGTPAKTEPLLILFGSQTGTAEGIAKRLARESASRGFNATVRALNDCELGALAAAGKALIISSTWGDGEPPDNAVNFWNRLSAGDAPRFENLQFAVLGLGDRNYSDFCGASKKFDNRLAELGANRVIPRGECDTDYETTAKTWIDGLWDKLGGSSPTTPANGAVLQIEVKTKTISTPIFDKSNPFPARLLKNVLLNGTGSAKEVRHYEIDLGNSGLTYHVGDALGVMPENCPNVVSALLIALSASGDEPVKVDHAVIPLRTALTKHFDIGRPSQELIAEIAKRNPEAEIAKLFAAGQPEELKKWLYGQDILDLLTGRAQTISYLELLPFLRKLAPRLYSISSSPKAHPGHVHLTVGAVRYQSGNRMRKGVASCYLADYVAVGENVNVFVQSSHGFKPPTDANVPMIMVGPSTGIAPFRAFLEERQIAGATGKNWLFFGDQTRKSDFLYEEQLTSWQQDGFLTRLDLAFSRDQAEKLYVQHRMLENAVELWNWLEAGAHFYVCGDAARMAKDVDAALHKVIELASGRTSADAAAYVEKLKSEKRYQRDVY